MDIIIIKEELRSYYELLEEIKIIETHNRNITKLFYKEQYIDITIELIPEIDVADKYYKTMKDLDSYLLQSKYNSNTPHNMMIYITENDRMIQIYKKNFTDIFDKDIKYMAEQIIDIYNYINMNRLIDSIVSSENIKIIFYQILDLIKNNKVKLNNITNIYGNKEVITNRILELLSNY
jgi:hypothetical protein